MAWFSDIRGRSRSLSLPSLSHLIYSVQSRVHDVRAPFCIWKANHNARKKWSVEKWTNQFCTAESKPYTSSTSPFWFDAMCGKLHSIHSTLFKIWYTRFDWWKLTMALTSWTRLRTEYIRREREGSERDRERPRTSESQATPCKLIEDSLGSWIPGIGFRIPCQWNLDSRFQSLAGFLELSSGFQSPGPEFTSKKF